MKSICERDDLLDVIDRGETLIPVWRIVQNHIDSEELCYDIKVTNDQWKLLAIEKDEKKNGYAVIVEETSSSVYPKRLDITKDVAAGDSKGSITLKAGWRVSMGEEHGLVRIHGAPLVAETLAREYRKLDQPFVHNVTIKGKKESWTQRKSECDTCHRFFLPADIADHVQACRVKSYSDVLPEIKYYLEGDLYQLRWPTTSNEDTLGFYLVAQIECGYCKRRIPAYEMAVHESRCRPVAMAALSANEFEPKFNPFASSHLSTHFLEAELGQQKISLAPHVSAPRSCRLTVCSDTIS